MQRAGCSPASAEAKGMEGDWSALGGIPQPALAGAAPQQAADQRRTRTGISK